MRQFIAQRELLYSLKGESSRKRLLVRISEPYLVEEGKVKFRFTPGTAGCTIEFEGIPESSIEVHGVDTLHALKLAADIDPYLRALEKKYDLFWASGDSYFD